MPEFAKPRAKRCASGDAPTQLSASPHVALAARFLNGLLSLVDWREIAETLVAFRN
jgi:hypothetical protein